MVYVPSTYTGSKKVPLVLVMHGYTASMYAIAEESRWYDVAEQNGFIVVFAQGLVRPADLMGNIPTAMWLAGPFAALAGKDTDRLPLRKPLCRHCTRRLYVCPTAGA